MYLRKFSKIYFLKHKVSEIRANIHNNNIGDQRPTHQSYNLWHSYFKFKNIICPNVRTEL